MAAEGEAFPSGAELAVGAGERENLLSKKETDGFFGNVWAETASVVKPSAERAEELPPSVLRPGWTGSDERKKLEGGLTADQLGRLDKLGQDIRGAVEALHKRHVRDDRRAGFSSLPEKEGYEWSFFQENGSPSTGNVTLDELRAAQMLISEQGFTEEVRVKARREIDLLDQRMDVYFDDNRDPKPFQEFTPALYQKAIELAGTEDGQAFDNLPVEQRVAVLLQASQELGAKYVLGHSGETPPETPTGEPGEQVEAGEEEKRTEQIMGDIASLFGIREDRMTEFFDLLGVSSSKFEQGKMTEEEFDEFTNKIKKMQEEGFNPNDVRTRIKLKIAADRLSEAFGLPSGISLSELQDKILEDCGITPEQIKTKSAGWLKGVWEKLKDWKKEKGKKERTNPLFWIFMLVMGLTNAIKETTPSPQAAQ